LRGNVKQIIILMLFKDFINIRNVFNAREELLLQRDLVAIIYGCINIIRYQYKLLIMINYSTFPLIFKRHYSSN